MRKTESYRRHHEELRNLIAEIEAMLKVGNVDDNLDAVSGVIRRLFGKFGTHLAIEDKAFYPKAIAAPDKSLSALAQQFQDEMGPISVQFEAYRKKWPGPLAISRDIPTFVNETNQMIVAFKYRLDREENELYELYDKVA